MKDGPLQEIHDGACSEAANKLVQPQIEDKKQNGETGDRVHHGPAQLLSETGLVLLIGDNG